MKYLKLLTVILRAHQHKAEKQQYVAYLNDGRGFSRLLLYGMNVVYCRHVRYGYARNLDALGWLTISLTMFCLYSVMLNFNLLHDNFAAPSFNFIGQTAWIYIWKYQCRLKYSPDGVSIILGLVVHLWHKCDTSVTPFLTLQDTGVTSLWQMFKSN